MNLSCNMLGIGGIATPLGVKAIEEMEKNNNYSGQVMFFVINAASVQLLPGTLLSIRAMMGSQNPAAIIFPVLLTTLVTTLSGIILVKFFIKTKKTKKFIKYEH